jgi:hypothetical protein
MTSTYKYRGAPEARFEPREVLPEDDYDFVVASVDRPYFKNEKWIIAVKLIIEPSGLWVFANPWTGVDRNGKQRDGIAEFLLACNRVPEIDQEPDWNSVIGARGKCRLKVEVAGAGALAGKEVNKVAFFHQPKEIKQPSVSTKEYGQLHKEQKQSGAGASDLNPEPDDIPF